MTQPIVDVYNTLAGVYDQLYTDPKDLEENQLLIQTYRELPPLPEHIQARGLAVTDVGCGTGLALDLELPGEKDVYLGVDPSERMLKRLHEKHPEGLWLGLNADLGQYVEQVKGGVLARPDRLLMLFGVPSYCHPEELLGALDILAEGGSAIFLPYNEDYLPVYHENTKLPEHTLNLSSLDTLLNVPGMKAQRLDHHYLLTYTKPVKEKPHQVSSYHPPKD